METLKVASLFCGCGGTDVGLTGNFEFLGRHYDSNGMEIVYANDIDANACALFEKNFGLVTANRIFSTLSPVFTAIKVFPVGSCVKNTP